MQNVKLKIQNYLFLIIFLGGFIFPLFSFADSPYGGLVPCGCAGYNEEGKCCAKIETSSDGTIKCVEGGHPCGLCDLFALFKNIIDFLLFKIVPPLAIVMLVIAGIMYMLAYVEVIGNPGWISQAKSLIWSVVWGLIIIYGAWVIVNLFFQIIGISKAADNPFRELPQNWWKIECSLTK